MPPPTEAEREIFSMASTPTPTRKAAATKRSTTAKKAATTRARKSAANTRSSARTAASRRVSSAGTSASRRASSARSTASRRASSAQTTATRRTRSATRRAESATRTPATVVSEYAERAVLIPVGVALTARDRVNDVITSYSTPTKAQSQLKKFERRGNTARKSLQREVRKTRTRIERELRLRRRELERTVTRLDRRRGTAAAQVENVMQTGIKDTTQLAARVQDRVLSRS